MEQNFQIDIIEAQIRECFGRVVWSHKTQEKCSDILLKRNNRIKIIQIIFSALITTGILVSLFGKSDIVGIISAIISTLLFALNTYIKDYDLGEIAQKHANAASLLWDIREKYLSLITDVNAKIIGIEQIIKRRDELQNELFNIYKGSPRSFGKAYKEARDALKLNEELTFSDEEIDAFLPKELRKTNKNGL